MEATCVNLLQEFGDRFKIGWDEAYDPKGKHNLDPWMMTLRCQRATIYPYGSTKLVAEVDGRAATRKALAALPCCRQIQAGDTDGAFLFDMADFKAVAQIVKPRRRRQVSPEQLAAASERLRIWRSKSLSPERVSGA